MPTKLGYSIYKFRRISSYIDLRACIMAGMKKFLRFGLILAGGALAVLAWQSTRFAPLKSNALIGRQPGGEILLPTNQLIGPWGEQALIQGRPVDMVFDPEERIVAVLNNKSVDFLSAASGAALGQWKLRATSYAGLAFRPGTRELWTTELAREGDRIVTAAVDVNGQATPARSLALKNRPVPIGIAFSMDGKLAFVAFSRSNTLAIIDTERLVVDKEIPVGNAPFAVAVGKNGVVYVANRGGRKAQPGDPTGPSSGTRIVTDPATGAAGSGTLSVIDPAKGLVIKEIGVGLAPAALALSPDGKTLAVANSNSDTVSLMDTATLQSKVVKIPTWPESAIGSQPIGLRYAPDGKALYVACGGNNAIAVVTESGKVAGAIPAGWFPSSLLIDRSNALRILNVKGVGSTSNGKGGFNSREYQGSLLKLPMPTGAQLAAGTDSVRAANQPVYDSNGGVRNLAALGIEHVLFIVKENRTYDQVFGDMGKGNSDPKLVMYPREVSPNHHALADQYVLLDNFYTGGAISFDGHQWLMQAFVSDYVERAFSSSPRGYAWNMADALTVSPLGFFWQGGSKPLGVRIYGEFCVPGKWNPAKQNVEDMNEDQELTWAQYYKHWKDGTWPGAVGCQPGVPAMAPYMDLRAPHDAMAINDQIRADEFLREFRDFELANKVPNLSVLLLNSDHTQGKKPGYPTPRAMVADNDLALGRIIEALSKSKSWAKMLVLVVEDDAQDGVDHVDGHRTLALAIGPHIKRGAVDSNNYNHTSMVRTIQEIFNIPSRTRFVKAARAMNSVFETKPVLTPYQTLTPKVPLDEMNPPLQALTGKPRWAAEQSIKMDLEHVDRADKDALNRILWWEAKGYDVPYPAVRSR